MKTKNNKFNFIVSGDSAFGGKYYDVFTVSEDNYRKTVIFYSYDKKIAEHVLTYLRALLGENFTTEDFNNAPDEIQRFPVVVADFNNPRYTWEAYIRDIKFDDPDFVEPSIPGYKKPWIEGNFVFKDERGFYTIGIHHEDKGEDTFLYSYKRKRIATHVQKVLRSLLGKDFNANTIINLPSYEKLELGNFIIYCGSFGDTNLDWDSYIEMRKVEFKNCDMEYVVPNFSK